MDREELKKLLANLYYDLKSSNEEILKKYFLFNMTKKDRDEYYKKIFIDENLPTNVINYEKDMITKDIDFEFLDRFVQGLDEYIKSQESELNSVIIKQQNAVKLFREIISLPSPMSEVLYLTYFKKMNHKEVMASLYMSRPTYFRTKRTAISLLLKKIIAE